jgi:rod shape-determining protein MreC
MRTLFAFFKKNYFFFLFAALEVIAILLMVNHNPYQHTRFFNTSNRLVGNINMIYANIDNYFYLKKSNEILLKENARLRSILRSSFLLSDTVTYAFMDTNFRYIPANIISNSINKRSNYLMLDKGKNHGVEREMGVVSSNGIIGIVVEVSDHFCTVMSLLHKDSKFSARIKKNNQLANVIWEGKNHLYATLQDIPSHIILNKGDTIITSGFSFFFPEGIMIGTIEEFDVEQRSNFNKALIKLSNDFSSIKNAFILKNIQGKEQRKLMEISENE